MSLSALLFYVKLGGLSVLGLIVAWGFYWFYSSMKAWASSDNDRKNAERERDEALQEADAQASARVVAEKQRDIANRPARPVDAILGRMSRGEL